MKVEQNANGLTNAEDERLAVLLEEMGECLQIIGKIQRHGYESRNPLIEDSKTNREKLELEVGDVVNAIRMMVSALDLDGAEIESHSLVKAITIKQWLHHQNEEVENANA